MVFPAEGQRRGRVALLQGCAQQVLSPGINQAAIRMLTRQGIEVALVADEQCCGSLTHHMGHDGDALKRARANIEVWTNEIDRNGLDAILVTTSGCGTTIKDYGYMLREDRMGLLQKPHVFRLLRRTSPSTSQASTSRGRKAKTISSLRITPHVRCSTDRKSRSFRKNCFPRADSW